jgi:hypothetical protein
MTRSFQETAAFTTATHKWEQCDLACQALRTNHIQLIPDSLIASFLGVSTGTVFWHVT